MQQPSESPSDRLFPRFDALVKPAFLSIAGSIPAFIFAAFFYALNLSVDYAWIVSLLYGNIGSVLLAYSIVALVARVHRGLWGFFIILYSILDGILGLFFFGYFSILALVGPIAGFIGGILVAVRPIFSGQAKVYTKQPPGASLVVSGGILLSSLSLWLVLFAGPTVVITFFAGTALVLLGLLLRGGQTNHPAIGRAVVVTGLVATIPLLIWTTNATDGLFQIWAALWLTGVALSVLGGLRILRQSSALGAMEPSAIPTLMPSGLNMGRAEIFSLAGSLVPSAIIWTALVTPYPGNGLGAFLLYPEFGGPGQVLFAFAIALFLDIDHRRFWGLTLSIASVLIGIGFFAAYTYPFFVIYSALASQNELVFAAGLRIAFFAAPVLCFLGGLIAFLKGHHSRAC